MHQTNEANSSAPFIDHPSQAGWFNAVMLSPQGIARVNERFGQLKDSINPLVEALGNACMMAAMSRETKEYDNLSWLATGGNESAVRAAYQRLAGNPQQIGEYVRWFSETARRALDSRKAEDKKRFRSISLELGGIQQNGDWDCTQKLDDMARALPEQILEADRSMNVAMVATSNNRLGYMLMPLFFEDTDTFGYAAVRRRRAVADVTGPRETRIEIFKQTYGMLVLNELEDQDRVFICGEATEHGHEWCLTPNNSVANVAGREFEKAIKQEDHSGIRTVIPISTQYLMRMRGPETELLSTEVAA